MNVSRIVIIHGEVSCDATPDEQDTLAQVEAVAEELRALGHTVEQLAVSLDLPLFLRRIETYTPDLVFNLVETFAGSMVCTSWVPALLEQRGWAHTGGSARALLETTDKCLAKRLLRANSVDTPEWWDPRLSPSPEIELPSKLIIKSVHEEGSIGLTDHSVGEFESAGALRQRVRDAQAGHGGDWFAEEFIDGREFNISVLEAPGGAPRVLPIAEIDFGAFPADRPKIVGYAAKWDEGSFDFKNTTPTFSPNEGDQSVLERLRAAALRCWSIFGLTGYARVDIRLSADGTPYVLEVNANPCIAREAGFSKAASRAGLSYPEMIQAIVESALLRGKHG